MLCCLCAAVILLFPLLPNVRHWASSRALCSGFPCMGSYSQEYPGAANSSSWIARTNSSSTPNVNRWAVDETLAFRACDWERFVASGLPRNLRRLASADDMSRSRDCRQSLFQSSHCQRSGFRLLGIPDRLSEYGQLHTGEQVLDLDGGKLSGHPSTVFTFANYFWSIRCASWFKKSSCPITPVQDGTRRSLATTELSRSMRW